MTFSPSIVKSEPRILYEDKHIIVVLKGPGWLCAFSRDVDHYKGLCKVKADSLPTLIASGDYEQLAHFVTLKFGGLEGYDLANSITHACGIAHRLDVNTSGCLMIGKTLSGFRCLRESFVAHRIYKEYICLVHGALSEGTASVEFPVKWDEGSNVSSVDHKEGLWAKSIYTAMKFYRLKGAKTQVKRVYTLCRVVLITGRTHQIRVHMKAIGHPVVADTKYNEKHHSDLSWCPRTFLHAHRISFCDVNNKPRDVVAPLTQDLLMALKKLEEITLETHTKESDVRVVPQRSTKRAFAQNEPHDGSTSALVGTGPKAGTFSRRLASVSPPSRVKDPRLREEAARAMDGSGSAVPHPLPQSPPMLVPPSRKPRQPSSPLPNSTSCTSPPPPIPKSHHEVPSQVGNLVPLPPPHGGPTSEQGAQQAFLPRATSTAPVVIGQQPKDMLREGYRSTTPRVVVNRMVPQFRGDDTEEDLFRKALLMSEREEEERKRREALYDDALERAVQMVNSTPTAVNGTVLVPTMSNVVLQVTEDDTEEEMLRKALLVSERVEEERKQREALESTAIAVVLGLSLQSVESTVDEELLAVIRLSERAEEERLMRVRDEELQLERALVESTRHYVAFHEAGNEAFEESLRQSFLEEAAPGEPLGNNGDVRIAIQSSHNGAESGEESDEVLLFQRFICEPPDEDEGFKEQGQQSEVLSRSAPHEEVCTPSALVSRKSRTRWRHSGQKRASLVTIASA